MVSFDSGMFVDLFSRKDKAEEKHSRFINQGGTCMKKTWLLAARLSMLAGCGRQNPETRIDTTKSEAKAITFNLVEKTAENKISLYQCRKMKTIDGELREQILSFDERVRQSKKLISKEVLLGNPRLGIYQLCLKNKDKENRYLNLDFENKTVTF